MRKLKFVKKCKNRTKKILKIQKFFNIDKSNLKKYYNFVNKIKLSKYILCGKYFSSDSVK